jgi:N,N-dimethylformamidase
VNSRVVDEWELIGYADRLSVEASETISFMISTSQPEYDVEIVRLIHADESPDGPGFKEEIVASEVAGCYPGREQEVHAGSYLIVDDPSAFALSSFTLQAWIAPTAPTAGRDQAIMGCWTASERSGFGLFVNEDGFLSLRLGANGTVAEIRGSHPLQTSEWVFVAGAFDAVTQLATLEQQSLSPWDARGLTRIEQACNCALASDGEYFRVGGAGSGIDPPRGVAQAFDGKIDSPCVFARSLTAHELVRLRGGEDPQAIDSQTLVAAWDFRSNQQSTTIDDVGPRSLRARAVNMPARAVTGRDWKGAEVDFRLVPEEYSAIHFHSDDLEDAAWESDFAWNVPPGLRSGVYAARISANGVSDHIPFVLRPGARLQRPEIVVLLPTFTYIAYANERVGDSYQTCTPPDWVLQYDKLDLYLEQHPEFGKSLYDVHDDQSGVFYSSALRPIPNLRPRYRTRNVNAPRHLAGDLYLIDWLERKNFAYDVITDGDLHDRGRELLNGYRTLITGSHPEYVTTRMLETVEGWVHDGGRMMYLGGNGFYWVTSVHPERQHVIEVRRGRAGSRPWESQPGEEHHSTTGEIGGLWRYRAKLPNRLTGIAYAAEGGGVSGGYTRTAASHEDQASWIFKGVSADTGIGAFGLVMGGAAGDEVDRADPFLGTPPDAVTVASSDVLPFYCVSLEDQRTFRGGRPVGEARADMVLLRGRNGGAVFSVGSISWSGALSHNEYDNDISLITENVLRMFTSTGFAV